jgi:hypothetical protein
MYLLVPLGWQVWSMSFRLREGMYQAAWQATREILVWCSCCVAASFVLQGLSQHAQFTILMPLTLHV